MDTISTEEVKAKQYKNTTVTPMLGDIVKDEYGEELVVGRIGDCIRMFQNCTVQGIFILTHPEKLTLIGKSVFKITKVFEPNYNGQDGTTDKNQYFIRITNFGEYELETYTKAINTFVGDGQFGIADVAMGFNEDEGYSFLVHGHCGLYATKLGENGTSEFFKHFNTIKKG